MSHDARCTLPHDPSDADRDMPCYYCQTYGHISEPRVSLDLRRIEQTRRRAARNAYRAAARRSA